MDTHTSVLSQTIDIPATLLDYFGIANELDMDGKSLLPALKSKETVLHDEIILEQMAVMSIFMMGSTCICVRLLILPTAQSLSKH